jgi:hypothetical protein
MRTILELPDDLMERARTAAKERGVTLRELVGDALAKELLPGPAAGRPKRRVRLPIFPSNQPGSLELSAEDLANAEAAEDARRHGLSS